MLDHTLVLWTNELGKGNSHTLNDIPFLLAGGGFGFKMGRRLPCGSEQPQPLSPQFGSRRRASAGNLRQPRCNAGEGPPRPYLTHR